jgi:trehalose 6-phosphate synthase
VLVDGRLVYARSYPISIDTTATTRLASSRAVAIEEWKIKSWRPRHLIVRIDRTDPSKNILRGFLAYELMLLAHPELVRQVQFWAFLQSSRQDVAAYRNYLLEIRRTAARVNSRHGQEGWLPIRLEIGESQRKALACLKSFDVLLVNPIYDGLNLISKEGALVNQTNGVIVLSENAGAHEELSPHVLSINPFDIEATSQALYRALVMPQEERTLRSEGARQVVRNADLARWIFRQVEDLRDLLPTPFERPIPVNPR